MFITIDGCSGAGKSTQVDLLVKRLRLEPFNYRDGVSTLHDISCFLSSLANPHKIVFSCLQTFECLARTPDCICDHFWEQLYSIYSADPCHNTSIVLANALKYFRTGMKLSSYPEPDVSILIDVPADIATIRRIKRDDNVNLDLESQLIPTRKHNRHFYEFWDIIETNIPYFRRVDGTQSIKDVNESIIKILPINDKANANL